MTTPFNKDLSLDLEGLKALTDLFIDGGIPTVSFTVAAVSVSVAAIDKITRRNW